MGLELLSSGCSWRADTPPARVEGTRRTGFTGHGWTRTGLLRPLMAEYVREGSWPTGKHWEAATAEHPSRRTYVRRFGSWDHAVDAAVCELRRLAALRG